MPTPTINFQAIRPHHGSQHGGFEELVCQLAALDTTVGVPFHRKGAGADAGLECYRVERDESEIGWQAKYFFELGSGETAQLKESFDTAVDKHPSLARFIVCLPFDLSDGRVGARKSERDRWNDWVNARQASIAPRVVEIELWGGFQLTERLSRNDPLHVGRRTYWFDLPHFGVEWLRDRFEITRVGLGRRYTPELNVELPIRQALAAFARDPEFVRRIIDWVDDLDEARHRSLRDIGAVLETTDDVDVAMLNDQVTAISAAIRTAPLGPTDPLPLDEWRTLVTAATTTLDRCWAGVWELRRQPGGNRESVRNGLYFAAHLREALDRIAESLNAPWVSLANAHRLLLSGEAGVGKSHLLADVAEHHIARGFPAVLTLGGEFSDAEPWRQIAEQSGLTNTPPDAILGALDAAAEAAGTRALVMVDAINERNGIAVWSERLATFFAVADRFSHVAILVSCRTTFLPYIVRNLEEDTLPRLEHPGFAGKAAEAARRYLDQRGIVRMAAPYFAPEFENPLFLRTCCDMLERRRARELPRGLDGVSSIFDFYFGAVVETLNQRMGLVSRRKLVETGLSALTEAMVAAGVGYLPIDTAIAILDEVHPSAGSTNQDLFFQLENEGVIAVEPVREGDAIIEMVRFTFERMSDHLIAQRLLDTHVDDGDPASAFSTGGPLVPYVAGRDSYQFAGIAEALAVQLPERYGIELIDAIDDKFAPWDLVHAFQLSLLWRRQDVFSERTLELVEEWADAIGVDAVLETILAIATEPNNRFNADHLDRWLHPLLMPERDAQWSTRAMLLIEESEAGEEVINTLIEWILANGLEQIEPARARLAAITLAWLTSLSHRWVRDMATKALATLLVDRRELAAALIDHFADVDDAYVIDRVLAAAYGAATRCSSDEGLAELSRAAFAAVFARNPLPTHALVRDHARGIVELAASRGVLPDDVPLDCARPPYPRGEPLETITDEALSTYVQDYGRSVFRNQICGSAVEDGDFARYEIDSLASDFLRLPREEHGRSMRDIYEEWHGDVIAPYPDREAAFARVVDIAGRVSEMPDSFEVWGHGSGADELLKARRAAEKARESAIEEFERLLDENEVQEFRIRAANYLRGRMWDERAAVWHPTYAREQSRHWVAWRAHELGWTPERFAEFDRQMASHGRMEHRIERIGKKYQWIAYHELTGRLSDIALVEGRFQDDPELYHGPWQVGTREMDPTNLVTRTNQHDSDRQGATWWSPHALHWREEPPEARVAWMEDQSRDIPNPIQQIDVADSDGRRWLVLNTTVGRNQWCMVNGERVIHRMTWHKVKSMLVARNDAERLEKHLACSARDREHPPEVEMPWGGYLGEYPWHPAFENIDGIWALGSDPAIQTQATVADWFVERAGHNYSVEESFNLTIPAPALMHGLHLRLADGRSLGYSSANGKILFKDPSVNEPGFSAAVVDRDAFRAFLDAEGLEIVWVFTGEKSAHGGQPHGRGWGGMLTYWGIYRFDGDSIRGEVNFECKDARPEQLKELLAYP
ncbi:ATP-binding protein [Halomonas sp. A40-4]|uniref:ATP-binding protein n=1 Tax=Halomonas sp. A40-4 TaxID=2785909 RepID=UPI0018F0131F|nr:ATP-binding protein [Halomonas sp. A40-4]QPL46915.1 ATP-binding protein [Halomonas sp. A40-4]